jgi:heat shock protein HtpX
MYKQISSNVRLTWGLVLFFIIFVISLGWIFARIYNSQIILVIAVAISLFQALLSYYYSDKIALLTSGARQLKRSEAVELFRIVENLSIASGVKQPLIYIINDPMPNAFATGRDPQHASLAVTTGLLEKLNKTELEGVIAHEMSHVRNYDILVMTIVVVLVGSVALISNWFLRFGFWGSRDSNSNGGGGQITFFIGIILAILAPISATLIQLAISRNREYLADASAALLTRYPEGLASALEKISSDKSPTNLKNSATAHLYIANPFRSQAVSNLFSTHPPIADRVARLRKMIL